MKSRNLVDYITLFFKGIFMGIADAIPGVSGGTIALLLGIYEELISTISGLNINLLIDLKQNGFKSFWKKLNGNFLVILITGIGISLIFFIKISSKLLNDYPMFIWSFFLGLIIATVYVIFKLIKTWDYINIISAFATIILSSILSSISVNSSDEISLLYILVCGIIASSAMILPGISGSLILVIMGVYKVLIDSVNNLEISIIFTFIIGAITGLISFSKILSWLFNNYKNLTYSIMLGLVIGSIGKVWPWKQNEMVQLANLDMIFSVILVIIGFFMIFIIEKLNSN
tara:strand:- start:1300 stop:2160 length:861 start_codon:yes stop_codon:yes gene_type:complete